MPRLESEMDIFTKKRTLEITRDTHFNNNALAIEMGKEFGKRVGHAVADGLPLEMAFESCKEHFAIVGQTMIEISKSVTIDMLPKQTTEHKEE